MKVDDGEEYNIRDTDDEGMYFFIDINDIIILLPFW